MILHVACLPFPSPQGTQAAIDAMMRAHAVRGHEAHLLTYAHGSGDADALYPIHRVPDFPRVRSLRSGPSLGKIALDLQCIHSIRTLARGLFPSAIVAHHIEAAVAALVANVGPVYFVAHTSLPDELPVYLTRVPKPLVRATGHLAERWAIARSAGVGAVAPSLASLLGQGARHIPVPWPAYASMPTVSRREARSALGLPAKAHTCLYAGNLDRYQGWEHLLPALGCLRTTDPLARLLVATESDPEPLLSAARNAGVRKAVDLVRLDSERARVLAHAASDLAWIPRRTEGGLPIKMLDAFSRGVPVVAMARATAGLALADACTVVSNDDGHALAGGAARLLDDPGYATRQRHRAHEYLASEHSTDAFAGAMSDLLDTVTLSQPTTMRAGRRRQAAPELRAR